VSFLSLLLGSLDWSVGVLSDTDWLMISLLRHPPRNHPGGSANTSRFGGEFSTSGDDERELEVPFCHCSLVFIIKDKARTKENIYECRCNE
jgi:hypothetical protein